MLGHFESIGMSTDVLITIIFIFFSCNLDPRKLFHVLLMARQAFPNCLMPRPGFKPM